MPRQTVSSSHGVPKFVHVPGETHLSQSQHGVQLATSLIVEVADESFKAALSKLFSDSCHGMALVILPDRRVSQVLKYFTG
mmetsp:Transcript_53268/g.163877  ORF Transcript_53268/g.163877 Transcript_53268/m.163877 type:complete len:81 (+) Transcript_53268:333-575(+)